MCHFSLIFGFVKLKKYHLILIGLLGGVILSLGWPARGFPLLLFIGIVPFLYIEDYISDNKQDFGRMAVFLYTYPGFLLWNVLTTWWIWNATEAGSIAAFLLNAIFMSIVFQVYHFSKINRSSRQSYFILIFYWITFEYFHHNWDGNWPWLTLGNGLAAYIKWIQWYEFTGVFGGTLWILVTNIFIYLGIKGFFSKVINPWSNLVSAVLIILLPILVSVRMFNNYEEKPAPVDVVVVQPNMDPYSDQFEIPPTDVVDTNLNLARQKLDPNVDYIVSPESAIQERIWIGYEYKSHSISKLRTFVIKHPGIQYIIGASTFYEFVEGDEITVTARRFSDTNIYYDAFNTAFSISDNGGIEHYHKSKLTPGVEKMPYPGVFKFIERLAVNLGGTVGSLGTQPERSVFGRYDDTLKVAPVICYESVFGEYLTGYIRNGAHLIFVITNDGWWGDTPGHRQHFTFSQMRAIETRRSVARSANTGISAFINQRGEAFKETGYWEPAVIRQRINANDEITFYVKYGDYIARISGFVAVFILLIAIANKLRRK